MLPYVVLVIERFDRHTERLTVTLAVTLIPKVPSSLTSSTVYISFELVSDGDGECEESASCLKNINTNETTAPQYKGRGGGGGEGRRKKKKSEFPEDIEFNFAVTVSLEVVLFISLTLFQAYTNVTLNIIYLNVHKLRTDRKAV